MDYTEPVTVLVHTDLLAQLSEWSAEPVYVRIDDGGPDAQPPRYTMSFRTTMGDKPPAQMCRYPSDHHAHEWNEGGRPWSCPGWQKH